MRIWRIFASLLIIILLLAIDNSLANDSMIGGVLVQNASNSSSWNQAGIYLLNIREYNESIKAFDKAIDIKPDFENAWYNKGFAQNELGRYNDSVVAYKRAIEINASSEEAWSNYALALSELGRLDESILAYNEALNISPDSAVALYGEGVVLDKLQKYNDSILAYNKSILAYNNSTILRLKDIWFNKGNALFYLGRYNDSIDAYTEVLKIDQEYGDAWYNKGLALYNIYIYNESVYDYVQAIKIYSENENGSEYEYGAWNGQGNSLEKLNRTTEATIAFAKAKDLEYPNSMKVAIFISFLIMYIIILIIGCNFSRKCAISTEVIILSVNLLGFLSYCWILSGLFDFRSVELFFIYGFLASAITIILWLSLGVPLDNLWLNLVNSFSGSDQEDCVSPRIVKSICFAAMIVYVILSSIFYYLRLANSVEDMLVHHNINFAN